MRNKSEKLLGDSGKPRSRCRSTSANTPFDEGTVLLLTTDQRVNGDSTNFRRTKVCEQPTEHHSQCVQVIGIERIEAPRNLEAPGRVELPTYGLGSRRTPPLLRGFNDPGWEQQS